MLIRLVPEDIKRSWVNISRCIQGSIREDLKNDEEAMHNLMVALLSNKMQCWCMCKGEDENVTKVDNVEVYGYVVTQIISDIGTRSKSLLIYALFSFNSIPPTEWGITLFGLVEFAKQTDCYKITAYTAIPGIISIINNLGGDTSVSYCILPVK